MNRSVGKRLLIANLPVPRGPGMAVELGIDAALSSADATWPDAPKQGNDPDAADSTPVRVALDCGSMT